LPITPKDPDLKRERGYKHPKSYVRVDGSEVLYGKDWTKRKLEIWERGGGRCEKWVGKWGSENHDRCRNEMHDPHHKVKRSKRRDDRAENLIGLCRMHHELLDPRKVRWSSKEDAA
jgi:hypothetical protein